MDTYLNRRSVLRARDWLLWSSWGNHNKRIYLFHLKLNLFRSCRIGQFNSKKRRNTCKINIRRSNLKYNVLTRKYQISIKIVKSGITSQLLDVKEWRKILTKDYMKTYFKKISFPDRSLIMKANRKSTIS